MSPSRSSTRTSLSVLLLAVHVSRASPRAMSMVNYDRTSLVILARQEPCGEPRLAFRHVASENGKGHSLFHGVHPRMNITSAFGRSIVSFAGVSLKLGFLWVAVSAPS